MRPSCNQCGQDIIWAGFDPAVDEHICGICKVTMRTGAERERDRIIKLLGEHAIFYDGAGSVVCFQCDDDRDYESHLIALIKGEK